MARMTYVTMRVPAIHAAVMNGPCRIRTLLLVALFLLPWGHRWGHAAYANGRV
jgi:hypothetical protein